MRLKTNIKLGNFSKICALHPCLLNFYVPTYMQCTLYMNTTKRQEITKWPVPKVR